MILHWLVAMWISCSIVLAVVFALGVFRLGGFQAIADDVNKKTGKQTCTSESIQWAAVLGVLFWPLYGLWGLITLRR